MNFSALQQNGLATQPYDLGSGDLLKCRFEVDLNMASGSYNLCVMLYRYDTQSEIDTWAPPGKFFVALDQPGSKGLVNCNPKVVLSEIQAVDSL